MSDELLQERAGFVLALTLNRPAKLNALSSGLLRALGELVEREASRPPAERPRALIVTGAGDKAFAAGADLEELAGLGPEAARQVSEVGELAMRALEEAPFPSIAAVNGFALGGGAELALACDFIVASDRARFGLPEVGLGLIPGFGGTQRLARRIGIGHAREMIYTGRAIDAARAAELGLANEVVSHGELLAHAKAVAESIAENAPLAVATAKRLLSKGADGPLATALELESRAFGSLFATRDAKEGMAAFLAKRPAKYEGS